MNEKINISEEKSVDVGALLTQIWKDKLYILAITFIFILVSIFVIKTTTFKYDVFLNVIPSQRTATSQDKNIGGIASILGISSSGINKSNDDFLMYKTILKSRVMSEELSKDKEFLLNYFNSKNEEISPTLINKGHIILIDKSWRATIKNILGLPSHKKKITLNDVVYKKLVENVTVSSSKKTKVTTMNFKTTNPELGIILLMKMHNISDSTLKKRSLKRTEDYIVYLNDQLSKTTIQDQRLSLIATLADQQKSKMAASSDLSYAADLFGMPFHSDSPSSPRMRNILLSFAIVGFFSSLFLSVLRYFIFISKFQISSQ
mgnify:CR=1 FL=1